MRHFAGLRWRRANWPSSIAVVVVTSLGCYAYVPVAPGIAPVGRAILLQLTDSGTVALSPYVGMSIASVEGRLAADSADVYSVKITRTIRRDGTEVEWRGETVPIAHALVSGFAARRFSTGRTMLFSALTTGALVAITEAFIGGGGATVPGGTSSGPPTGR
jgi:hypothetical protein